MMCMETVLEQEVATTNMAIATERKIEAGSDEHLDLILELIDALKGIYNGLCRLNIAFSEAFQSSRTKELLPEIKALAYDLNIMITRYDGKAGFSDVVEDLRIELDYTEELISDFSTYRVYPDKELTDIFNLL